MTSFLSSLRLVLFAMLSAITLTAQAGISTSSIGPGDRYYVSDRALWSNCVLYGRVFVPSLPYGLTSAEAKKKAINTSTPKKGRAIVIAASQWWHIAVLEALDDSGKSRSLTLVEANYKSGQLTRRKVTCSNSLDGCLKEAKIIGFIK